MSSQTEYSDAYLAGFFDGDGHIGCHIFKSRETFSWKAIAMIYAGGCEHILKEFQRKFGGTLEIKKERRKNGAHMYRWSITATGERLIPFCQWAVQHCWYKKRAAQAALDALVLSPKSIKGGSGTRRRRLPAEVVEARIAAYKATRAINYTGPANDHAEDYRNRVGNGN